MLTNIGLHISITIHVNVTMETNIGLHISITIHVNVIVPWKLI